MGGKSSRLSARSKQATIAVLGLDGAGKTALLGRAARGSPLAGAHGVPTHGCGVVDLSCSGFRLRCLDLGGSPAAQAVWRAYYRRADAIVFVIDSSDRKRVERAGTTLQTVLDDPQLAGVPVLILANKQDLLDAVSGTELSDGLNCSQIRGRLWQIQQTSAKTGEGIQAAFNWLLRTLVEGTLTAKEMRRIRYNVERHKPATRAQ